MGVRSGNLTVDELNVLIDKKEIDTVIVAFTDMQGRLVGKRSPRAFSKKRSRTTVRNAATTCSPSTSR